MPSYPHVPPLPPPLALDHGMSTSTSEEYDSRTPSPPRPQTPGVRNDGYQAVQLPPTPLTPPPELPDPYVAMPRGSSVNRHLPVEEQKRRSSIWRRPDRPLVSVLHPLQLPFVPKSALSHKENGEVPVTIPPPIAGSDREYVERPPCKPFVTHEYRGTREHFRDIGFLGPITLHRIFVLIWIVGSGAALFWVQHWIWPGAFDSILNPDLSISPGWSWIGCIWLIALPAALASVTGNLMFRYPPNWLDDVKPHNHNVVFRIVSRGTNADCLLETMYKVRKVMEDDCLFPYLIEVVTDAGVFEAPDEKDFVQVKVPEDYETPNETKFKARALHYATLASPVPDDTWVVHLDEETRPTSSGVKGIAHFVVEAQSLPKVRHIGQGCMMYHRGWSKWPFLTLCDMRRTGDDMGLFYLQHNIGRVLLGLHGSFIVCRQDVEKEIGFDLGPKGSITEDAWWGLLAMDKGYRLKWCHGYLDEQCTESVMDFLKQRRRWYVGLWKVALFCNAPLKHRFVMATTTFIWVLIPVFLPFIVIYMTFLSYFRFAVPFFLRVLTNFIISANMIVYLAGIVANMREHGTGFFAGIFWILAMCITMPICYLLEAFAVIMAFFYPFSNNAKGFHVVNKSASGGASDHVSGKDSTGTEDSSSGFPSRRSSVDRV